MEIIIQRTPPNEWESINRMRQYKQIYFLSQVLSSDGTTILANILGRAPGLRSLLPFPRQEPTAADFLLWDNVLRQITSPKLRWSLPVGQYVRPPYTEEYWWTGSQGEHIYCTDSKTQATSTYGSRPTSHATEGDLSIFPWQT